ncbi:NADP-dependent phosphogluconate dehydrogenase [Cesiribacter sp. SM1]|uniref:NADP-dependent phosphogluconate dehydrogenase n=1 Tax=Cesiribacter sp. SM1 TaxID=2861196 RepID=UPI001CD46E42|nr:NADP-dependent phosphogluconate dehydrogenase [Cesiribacter sp. SM1]
MIFIVMGVSGSGKTTVGRMLAQELNLPFYDADDFHPATNVTKMGNGIALNDEDRQDWLEELAKSIIHWEQMGGAVLACSALKEKYRITLQSIPHSLIQWIFLEGSRDMLMDRIAARTGHYMPPALLDSQLETLEKPAYGIHISIAPPPDIIVQQIISKLKNTATQSEFGIVGMGVMGKSLALNLASKNINLSIYNRHVPEKEVDIAKKVLLENSHLNNLQPFDDIAAFVKSLETPRKILLMIVAGPVVDYQIKELLPLLDKGDVIIDGGNSLYKDTNRRTAELAELGIRFVGTGISGGEEGALKGPSMMPGGPQEGYQLVSKYLETIAAKDKNGKPCTTYIGPDGAGHFVKMVHNGIEYAEMQLLSETYYLLRYYLQLSPWEIAQEFTEWQRSGLESYLLEITIDILQKQENGELLLDKILDKAAQKGTGGWSVAAALEHGVPYGPLTEAVMARSLSSFKDKRVKAAELYQHQTQQAGGINKQEYMANIRKAYEATRIINHDIGFNLMQQVSDDFQWKLNFSEISRIWTNGCIIRSQLMEELVEVFKSSESILMAPEFVDRMKQLQNGFASVIAQGLQSGFALPVLSAALNYYLGLQTADSPANLLQAQRDYFGAHTYKRKDKPAEQSFHTIWKPL